MPIMSAVDRSDSRASARVLAKTVRRCIDGDLEPRSHRVEFTSLFRLLNAYRSHRFAGYEYEARSPRGPEALTLMPTADRHVVDLRHALQDALRDSYGDDETEHAIEQIDVVIRSVAKAQDPGDELRGRTVRFLDSFIDHLVVR